MNDDEITNYLNSIVDSWPKWKREYENMILINNMGVI